MADLSEFLGTIVSGVSNARMHADIETVRIANEYAKNDLLCNFTVPRMRFKDVEIRIPVAIQSMNGSQPKQYEPINEKSFLTIVYNEILRVIGTDNLPLNLSSQIRAFLLQNTRLLENRLKVISSDIAMKDFAIKTAADLMVIIDPVFKILKRKLLQGAERQSFQLKITDQLQAVLKGEIKIKQGTGEFASVNVITEADKLREIPPGNLVMITMKISEEGMEWHQVENKDGGITSKLIPE